SSRRHALAEGLLDLRPRRGAGFVVGELHADARCAVALDAVGRDPYDLALYGDALRIIEQRQKHEDFLAKQVLAIGRDEYPASLEKRHVRGVKRRLLADVERKYPRPRDRRGAVEAIVLSCHLRR